MSKDLSFPFSAVLAKDTKHEQDLHRHHGAVSGLQRLRSAPSNFLGDPCEEFMPNRSEAMGGYVGGKEGGSSSLTQLLFQSPHQQQQQQYSGVTTLGSVGAPEGGRGGGSGSGLVRHSSSPAGMFSHLGDEKGFNSGKLKTQMSFSSRQGSSNFMSQISEVAAESLCEGTSSEGSDNNRCYIPGYPVVSWEDNLLLSENFSGVKRHRIDPSEMQAGEMGNLGPNLTRHLSLPKMSSESEFIQFQDTVPWKLRAKRGCATHPRSIAERVRRTKISERIRKLQDLVPNMDKQTSTADMLDLAADYIKELQNEVKLLSEGRANCKCSGRPSDGFQ